MYILIYIKIFLLVNWTIVEFFNTEPTEWKANKIMNIPIPN